MRSKRLGPVSQDEIEILCDAVVDRLVKQRKHVHAQEEPSERAYEILDTLQSLRDRLKLLQVPRLQRPCYFP